MKHLLAILVVFVGLSAGCAAPRLPADRVESHALTDSVQTRLGQAVAPRLAQHPGLSGFMPFEDPHDAFAARVLLSRLAERSLDVQYFIWHGDAVGTLLWQAMWEAAERGVRVRLLVDDANNAGLDPVLAALDAHPNLELRLYNPFVHRGSRVLGYLTDFSRLNRRMHNKSFTADNQVSVVGGRNIADEYFGAAEGLGFADLDVMAIGPVVQEVSREFDLYWNSASAYPAAPFVGPPPADPAAVLQPRFEAVPQDPAATQYLQRVRRAPFVRELLERRLEFDWTTGQVLYDDPAKTLDAKADSDLLLLPVLITRMGSPQKRLDVVSPYFVPGAVGTEMLADMARRGLADMARRGVQVRVLTNSLASSDERVVHAGYLKRRLDLLRAGVQLWELKPTAAADASLRVRGRFGPAKVSGLHAKTYAVDGKRIFVGSFNFDQRSAHLNTEMGLVIDSPTAAKQLADAFENEVPKIAYEVRIAPDGANLQWVERTPSGGTMMYDVDPETSAW
ncbi:MAG: phospholipase D family protein, partial [Burkholderiaceae bacterium]|nr:phospholipase D family protein [Burkholderiaceae bacterium]